MHEQIVKERNENIDRSMAENISGTDIPTALTIRRAIFWDMTPCNPIEGCPLFGRI
jgi:hypothetical protein